jgi:hypothetical protein
MKLRDLEGRPMSELATVKVNHPTNPAAAKAVEDHLHRIYWISEQHPEIDSADGLRPLPEYQESLAQLNRDLAAANGRVN